MFACVTMLKGLVGLAVAIGDVLALILGVIAPEPPVPPVKDILGVLPEPNSPLFPKLGKFILTR